MTKNRFQTLFGYHWHTARRLMEAAARLSQEDYRHNPGYGHGSIHDLLYHVLRADTAWRVGLETGQQPPPLAAEDFPTLEALAAGFAAEQEGFASLLDGLTAAEIEADFSLTNRRGQTYSMSRWKILQHVILHGMQHFTEIAQLLTAMGQSPGDIDFIFYD